MGNAHEARYVGNVLGGITLGRGKRDSTRVLIAADLEPAAANEAEPASWNRRCSTSASWIGTASGLRIKCSRPSPQTPSRGDAMKVRGEVVAGPPRRRLDRLGRIATGRRRERRATENEQVGNLVRDLPFVEH